MNTVKKSTASKIIIIISVIIMITSCDDVKKNKFDLTHFKYNKNVEYPLHDPPKYKNVDIVSLETTEESLLSNIKTLEVTDELILIKDWYALFIFNRKGKFISRVGLKGGGPQEYYGINSFYIDEKNKTIVIIDEVKSALLIHDYQGKFISSKNIPLNAIRHAQQTILLNNSTLLINHSINQAENRPITHINGNKYKSFLTYAPIQVNNYLFSLSNHQMTKAEESVHFIMPLCDTIFSFTKECNPKYIIELPATLPSRKRFITDPTHTFSSILHDYISKGNFPGFTSIFETKEKILLEYLYDGLQPACYLGDKKTKMGNYILHGINNNMSDVPFFMIKQVIGEEFVGFSSAKNLLTIKKSLNFNSQDEHMKKLRKILENINEEDNPVIFFYTLF